MHDVIHMRQKYSEYYRLGQENDSKTTLALIKKKKKKDATWTRGSHVSLQVLH